MLRERYGLTRKEARVARLVAEGKSNEEVGKALSISPHTARHHAEQIMRKLGVKWRGEVGPTLLRG
ncbi:MAG: helix-turn-helix domain-containing protein [Longimicrobiaceae bacterium]